MPHPDNHSSQHDELSRLLNVLQIPEPPPGLSERIANHVLQTSSFQKNDMPSAFICWMADWGRGLKIKSALFTCMLALGMGIGHLQSQSAIMMAASPSLLVEQETEILYTALYAGDTLVTDSLGAE